MDSVVVPCGKGPLKSGWFEKVGGACGRTWMGNRELVDSCVYVELATENLM
jgi:hypothetical protein